MQINNVFSRYRTVYSQIIMYYIRVQKYFSVIIHYEKKSFFYFLQVFPFKFASF